MRLNDGDPGCQRATRAVFSGFPPMSFRTFGTKTAGMTGKMKLNVNKT